MVYLLLKHVHLTCVSLTLVLFSLRVYWRWTESARLQARWVRIVPHVIDSCLLASALGMVSILGWQVWIGAKITALFGYIWLGRLALKGKTPLQRFYALMGALGFFAYIVAVALTKSPVLGGA